MTVEVGYPVKKLRAVTDGARRKPSIGMEGQRFSERFGRFFTKRNSLIVCVLIPSLLAALYYFLIASGQYVTETRMVVRTIGVSERFDTSEVRSGRSIVGGDSLTQDSYIVANYLRSPQIVDKLDREMDLKSFFIKDDIDFLSRLSDGREASFEELTKYWNEHVDTYVDGPSGIIIFTVRAFSPEDSMRISKAALDAANQMIDKISEKAKTDLVARAQSEMQASLENYQKALGDLRDYQNRTGILDPTSSAKMVSAIIAKLTEEKLKLTVDLNSLKAAKADDTARGRELRRSIQALDDQIDQQQNSLAGKKDDTGEQLSSSMIEFSRLETRRIVTQALYEATARNLDTAQSTALKRTTFISVFSASHLPEKAKYPERFSEWLVLTAGLFTLWMTATLVWMSIEDHRV
ncbi:hypothetical protein [Rhizobium paknamense]|uniref:Capsular polysaccharide transport system permease protein n=1 Tax=Rhizobium paknamense TaxID=1206817 RepID=A0ABU0I9G8_9HYPH|nr:hypothetical protein [Rhizobium paknamense]MDQ0454879.1 capsular polysaccharide transport system permease protein [Rhizobium paknamense]